MGTRSTPVTRSTPSSSPPTATGCALPPPRASSSSTSRRRARLTSSSPSTSRLARRAESPSVFPSPGPPMARPSSLVTPTTRSAPGASCRELKCFDVSTVLSGGETGLTEKLCCCFANHSIVAILHEHCSRQEEFVEATLGWRGRMESVRRSAGYNRRFVQPKKKDSFRRFFSCQKDKCSNPKKKKKKKKKKS